MTPQVFFVTGGALQIDAGSYVERVADHELLASLRRGEFCYVLTSRQMGKSSLMVRTAAQLREEGGAAVVLDLTAIGQNLSVEQWYYSMLCHIAEKLKCETQMEEYWDANERRSPLHRLMGAIREVHLGRSSEKLTIFVDEIDAVRSLKGFSADEFFAGIRECYNRRAEDPDLERLTFCLLGVATPSDLIRDPRITPFNIGHGIELADFTEQEASVLAAGLSEDRDVGLELLRRVLHWTSGHPFLTQKLCFEAARTKAQTARAIDEVCRQSFLSAEARERDDNLHFVRERLLRTELDRVALLDTYAKVCRGERLADDHLNPLINELRLSGVVRVVEGRLRVRNRIYARVFDLPWVRENLPNAERRRQRAAFYRGVRRVAGLSVVVLAIMGALAAANMRSSRIAQRAAENAAEANMRERKAAADAVRAADEARAAADRERQANEDLLREAGRTKNVLNRLVETQGKVEALLEALTPLVGDESGARILNRAEEVVRGVAGDTADDPRVLLGQAGLLRVCGRLYLKLGDESAALQQVEEAQRLLQNELARPLVEREADGESGRDEDALKRQLHACHVLVGDIALGGRSPEVSKQKSPEDYARAVEAYRAAAGIAGQESQDRPADPAWRALYFEDLNNLGDTARLMKQDADARARYHESLEALEAVRQRSPEAPDLDWIEASIHDRLGTLYLDVGKIAEAKSAFDRSLNLRESNSGEAATEDTERLSDLSVSYNKMGHLCKYKGEWAEAHAYYERSLAIRRKICAEIPRLDWLRNLGFSLYNTAATATRLGQHKKALELSVERLRLAEKLFSRDPSDDYLKVDLGNALYGYADFLMNVPDRNLQNWPQALELTRQAAQHTDRRDPRVLALLAQAVRLTKAPESSREIAEEAARLLPPEDKRTLAEKEVAKEVAYELIKARRSP